MATITANAGAAGNWNSDSSWIGGVKPTAADDAVIPLATTSITIDAGSVCRSADFNTFTGTITMGSSGTLTIGDGTAGTGNRALRLPSGGTFVPNSAATITFVSTSATQQTVAVDSGYTMCNMTFNSTSNGNYAITQALTINTSSTLTLTQGTLHTDGASDNSGLSHTWGKFGSSSAVTRVINFGNSSITCTGTNGNIVSLNNLIGLTISTNTATITMSGANASLQIASGLNFNGSSIVMSGSGQAGHNQSFTCANFTRTGTAAKSDSFNVSGNITCTGTFTVNSNSAVNRVLVNSNTPGTARTITAASVVISNIVDFVDITGAGAATWTVAGTGATALGDCGGNSGITFTTPATQTYAGTSGGNWSANAWTSRVPLPQDDVVINAAFSASQTITADMPRLGKSIDFTGATGTPTLSLSAGGTIFGSLTLISGMSISGTPTLSFNGRSSYTITTAGITLTNATTFNAPNGTYTLQDNLTNNRAATGAITLTNGTLVDNGKTVALTGATSSFSMTAGTLTKTGTWNIGNTAAGTFWSVTGGTVNDTAGSIVLTTASANSRTFAGGGKTYYTLTYIITASSGTLLLTGSNTFNTINFYDNG